MPDYSEQLGKWVVFRVAFDFEEIVLKKWLQRLVNLIWYLNPVGYNKPLKIFNEADMCKYAERSNVRFWRSLYDGM